MATPRVGTGSPKGRSWKPSVSSCHAQKQPRGPGGTVPAAHTGFSVPAGRLASPPRQAGERALCLAGSKILVNYCEANSVRNVGNKTRPLGTCF